jgi:hypothetical protein
VSRYGNFGLAVCSLVAIDSPLLGRELVSPVSGE